MVWLNSNNVRDLRTPFGGVKASGLGEGGYRSIHFYTDQQAVHITLGAPHNPTFPASPPTPERETSPDVSNQRLIQDICEVSRGRETHARTLT